MKPISLTMQAFGSYGEKTTIDFTKPTQNLFLITGDTGSGKTTIFDAIVFALYGTASSTNNTKDGKELQSQYASITVEPFVELVFSEKCGLDEEVYTVRRAPKHTRAKQRGDGQTDEGAKISLVMPDGREYSNTITESNKKLEEIVGLTREQFMQIAMIAQGEFMELLRSKSNDKKEIYRKLFGTEQYDKIVKEFKKRRDNKLSEIQQIKTRCQTDISRVSVSGDVGGAQDLLDLQKRILSSGELNIVDLESFLEQLKTLCDHLQEKEREAKVKKEKSAKVRDEKQKKLTRAESLLSAFDQLNSAKNELDECEKNEADIKEKERLSQTIDISYELKGACDRYLDANKQVKQTEKALREQRVNLPSLEQKCKVADEAKNTAEEKWQEAAQKYSKVEDRVKKAWGVFAEISEEEKALDKANGELQKANETFNSAKKKFDDFERQVSEWNKEKNDLQDTRQKLEKCNRKIEDAEGILADIKFFGRDQAKHFIAD